MSTSLLTPLSPNAVERVTLTTPNKILNIARELLEEVQSGGERALRKISRSIRRSEERR